MKHSTLCAALALALAGLSFSAGATNLDQEQQETLNCSNGKDCWTSPDKKLHLLAGMVAGYGGTLIASTIDVTAAHPKLVGTAFGCAVGVGKELIDARFSSKDAIVTCLGSVIGAQLGGLLLDYNSRTKTTTVSYSTSF